jgi:hypothetical protein
LLPTLARCQLLLTVPLLPSAFKLQRLLLLLLHACY